jgi:solute carrier family 25 S-adenosylmethionine transporter 26
MFLCGSRHFWRQGSLWLAPFEGTKQRVQAGLFPSIRSAFTETFRDKGIAGLYAGYKAQVVRDIAFHMVQLPLYEAVRDAWVVGVQPLVGSRERHNAHAPMLSTWESLLCGALTGATSGAVTTPIDVVKTRLMARQVGVGNSSIRQAVVDILSREGLGGFSAGLAQRATYIACGSAIFFTVYEQVRAPVGHGIWAAITVPPAGSARIWP